MNKEVKYNGYSAVPSDYECQDGDLAVSLNLLSEKGAVGAVSQPVIAMALEENKNVLYIHETTAYKHCIIYDESTHKLAWSNAFRGETSDLGFFSGISHCNAVGNTLLVFTDTAIHYFLWADDKYESLGTHLPEVEISFGLVGHPRLFSKSDESKSTFKVNFAEGVVWYKAWLDLSEKNQTAVTEAVMAKVNKFVAEQSVLKGRFCFPFFVRYALRLYDGTITMHSAPILMNPHTLAAPIVMWRHLTGKNEEYKSAECDIMLVSCDLDYKVIRRSNLDKWKDIVTGVDVYISKPIYTYDQNGKITGFRDYDNFDTTFIGRLYHGATNRSGRYFPSSITEDAVHGPMAEGQDFGFLDCYAEWDFKRIYALYFSEDRTYPGSTFHMPEFESEKVGESLRSCAHFYKLHSIPLADLTGTARKQIPIAEDYLQSLVTRECMTDDYLSHDALSASYSQVYNARLNLSGVKRTPFAGFSPDSMFGFTDKFIGTWVTDSEKKTVAVTPSLFSDNITITIYLREGGKVFALPTYSWYACGAFLSPEVTRITGEGDNKKETQVLLKRSTGSFIFYPNVNAVAAVITSNYGNSGSIYGGGSMTVELKPHDFLNGAYALLDFNAVREHAYNSSLIPTVSASNYDTIDTSAKLFTSEVNNPFYFPVTGINTIGTGRILGMATAAKALSQGQFGQFPLYAFTSDGVWALEVGANGSFSAKQPITRDVCINPYAITQIDSAVLFPTARGIMMISGSQTQCISEPVNSDTPFDVLALPGMDKLHSMLGHPADTCLPAIPFSEFLADCGIIYDYVHQRVYVFNKVCTYAYVYSLKSQLWGMVYSDIQRTVNAYPEALAMSKVEVDGVVKSCLVDFSQESSDPVPGLLVSRPMKLDAPDLHKTISTVIQRGNFAKGHIRSVLYGSRDLINWHLVWSANGHALRGFRGTPYKYFRIALLCSLAPGERLYGASVEYVTRLTNRMR